MADPEETPEDDQPEEVPSGMHLGWEADIDGFDVSHLPEPFRNMIQQAQEQRIHHKLLVTDTYHNEMSFYDTAPVDFLRAHLTILNSCDMTTPAVAYHIGLVQATIKQRFNICPLHQVDHDKELQDALLGEPGDDSPPAPE